MQYKLHPALIINISTHSKKYRQYLRNEYERVHREYSLNQNATKVNVRIVNKLPSSSDPSDIHKKVTFKKLFNYEYVINGLNSSSIDIFFKDNLWGHLYAKNIMLYLQAQIVEPIIYLKLLEQNILFMHAAGVSDGKQGYLFPARGGTGKTTLSLGLMREGLQFLGDDLLIIEPHNKMVYPYLRPLHIFRYNVNTLRDATVPTSIRYKIYIKDLIRKILEKITSQEFLISTRVHADSIYPDFNSSEPVKYKKVIMLTKTGDATVIKLDKNNLPKVAQELVETFDLNKSLYSIVGKQKTTKIKLLEVKVMTEILQTLPHIEYVNTRRLNFNNLIEFKNHLLT